MASGHAARQWIEAFKFTVYVGTPIAATIYLGTGAYPYLERIIHNTAYVVYPAETQRPPVTASEVDTALDKMKQAHREKHPQNQ